MSAVIYISGVPSSPRTGGGQSKFSIPLTRKWKPDVFSTYTAGGEECFL